MFCVSSSEPGQVCSCCKRAAVGWLYPSSCSPSSPSKRHGARPHHGSGPSHKPPAAALRSLPTTEHSQGSLPSFLPSQQGWWGGSRAARAPTEQSPPWGGCCASPITTTTALRRCSKGAALKLKVRGSCAQHCRQTDCGEAVGREKGEPRAVLQKKENQLHVSSPVPASHVAEARKPILPSPHAEPAAEILKGLKRHFPGRFP